MIIGAHSIIYSTNPDVDRAFIRDVLKFPSVDVGGGWLIFGLPPAEVAVHPSDKNDVHEFYLMCDDVNAFIAEMEKRGVASYPVQNEGWGLLTQVTLPGGGKLGIYQPSHARPEPASTRKAGKKAVRRGAKKPSRKAVRAAPKRGKRR
jgi:hypothetical protein